MQTSKAKENGRSIQLSYLKDSRLSPSPLFLLSFMLPKSGIHSFKSVGSPLQNERDHAYPDLENFFFLFFSALFFSFLFFFLLLHIFCSYFFFFFSLNSLHFVHLQSRELPQSVSDFPQLHKHSSIHEVKSWPHLSLCLTTKNPNGLKEGCKKPTKWPTTRPKLCLGLIWSLWARTK